MLSKRIILEIAGKSREIKTLDISTKFNVSRQYASNLISELVSDGRLIKIGSTRGARYVAPEYAAKHRDVFPSKVQVRYKNISLEEHKVLDELESKLPAMIKLSENVRSIFTYAFSEMFNNAIEHSRSEVIDVELFIKNKVLNFIVSDYGVGVFRNIMQKKSLKSEFEAIQDLLKGKTTTLPKSHSGEGIFFTSKVGDIFILNSFGFELATNNNINDVFVQKKRVRRGTKVTFKISVDSKRHLEKPFRQYTTTDDDGIPRFEKTEIKIKLYMQKGIHVSRSQARRVLSSLDKFRLIIFDYYKVPLVGQAFADEIYRVFANKHPDIDIKSINANEAVQFMIDRVEGHHPRKPSLLDK